MEPITTTSGKFAPFRFDALKVGGVYYIEGHQTSGAELRPKNGRPAVVLYNDYSTVTIGYLTSTVRMKSNGEHYKGNVQLTSTKYAGSIVKLNQITTIDACLVGDFADTVSEQDLNNMRKTICDVMGCSNIISQEEEKPKPIDHTWKEKYLQAEAKLEVYKGLCDKLMSNKE